MAHVAYQVDGVPQTEWAHAFFPTPGLTPAGATSLTRFVSGLAGTERIPSPKPAGAFRASSSRQYHAPSEVAPDWFAPQIWTDYYTIHAQIAPTSGGSGVKYMPHRVAQQVPPVVPQGTLGALGPSQVAMGGRKVGGRRSMHWPRLLPRWPNLAGEYT